MKYVPRIYPFKNLGFVKYIVGIRLSGSPRLTPDQGYKRPEHPLPLFSYPFLMYDLLDLVPQSINLATFAAIIPTAFVLAHVVPYFYDPHGIRLYSGPFIAKFSDIWLGIVAKNGHRSEVVHRMHLKYGSWLLPNAFW